MKKTWLILLLFLVIKVILQAYAIDPVYELHRDEYLHLDLGKHPDWGYLTVPPLTGLVSWFIYQLGGTVFWVKFFPALFGTLLLVVVFETIRLLKGGMYAQILALSGLTFSSLVRVNILFQPSSLEILLWALVFYLFARFLDSGNHRWIYWTAVAFAAGFMNKYNICFLASGFLIALILSGPRKIFLDRHLYFAAGIALLLILPNLLWQFENGFPVFHHMKELANTQLINVRRTDFLLEQLYFFTGSWPVILFALAAFFLYPPFRKFRMFFWVFMIILSIYTYLRAKNYYAIGLYPVFIAFGSVWLEKLLEPGRLRWVRGVAVLVPVSLFILLFPFVNPVWTPEQVMKKKDIFDRIGLTRWEDGRIHDLPQDYADMQGWKELAHLVDSAFQMTEDKEGTIVHCDNYGQAGAVNYYSEIPGVKAYSMNADYINWYPLDQFEINNAILVKDIWDDDVNREREKTLFEEIRLIGEIKNPYAREKGTRVFLLRNAHMQVNEILRQEIKERKQKQRLM